MSELGAWLVGAALFGLGILIGTVVQSEHDRVYEWNEALVKVSCLPKNGQREDKIARVISFSGDGDKNPLVSIVWPFDPNKANSEPTSQYHIDFKDYPLGCMIEGLTQKEARERSSLWHGGH